MAIPIPPPNLTSNSAADSRAYGGNIHVEGVTMGQKNQWIWPAVVAFAAFMYFTRGK